jgi:cobalt-zinc-cadmium efflux system protein
MIHSHSPGEHPHHHPIPTNYNQIFVIGVALNVVFVVIESAFGLFWGSLALLADAGHHLIPDNLKFRPA